MATTYRKTSKGVQEIQQRLQRLAPRLRSLLILVDGRRSDAELLTLLRTAEPGDLAALLDGGFIETIAQKAPAQAPAPVAAPPAAPSFEQRRQQAVRALLDHLGPAGESAAMKLERATPEDFRSRVQMAAQVLASIRGAAAGQAYLQRFGAG